jgi:hypothetical protein
MRHQDQVLQHLILMDFGNRVLDVRAMTKPWVASFSASFSERRPAASPRPARSGKSLPERGREVQFGTVIRRIAGIRSCSGQTCDS